MNIDSTAAEQAEKNAIENADKLNRLLYDLNRQDDHRYCIDNGGLVERGMAAELSVYSHIEAALMQVLLDLAGTEERAEDLRNELIDCVDEGTAYVLEQMRREWAAEDAEEAIVNHPTSQQTTKTLNDAYTRGGIEAERLARQDLLAAGALWHCPACEATVLAMRTVCDYCDAPRPSQVSEAA